MFGKLKEKLKQSFSLFSKKAEAVAEEQQIPEEKSAGKPLTAKEKQEQQVKPAAEELQEKIPTDQKTAVAAAATTARIKEEKVKKVRKEAVEIEHFSKKTKKEKTAVPAEESAPEAEEQSVEKRPVEEPVAGLDEDISAEESEEPAEEVPEEVPEKLSFKKSFFSGLKKTFTTKTISEQKFTELFWDLELVLLENNVSVKVIEKIKEDLKLELVNVPLPRDVPKKIAATLKQSLTEILSFDVPDLLQQVKTGEKPFVIAFFGVNGAGKTTSLAKLAYYLQKNKLSVVFAACDTFRAAAIQQLQEHADKLNLKMIKHDYGSDAAAVAFDAVQYARKNKVDVVLIDTAGRLHSNVNLMAELEKIIRVVKPQLKLFVGESITGNDCVEQAKTFNQLVEMDGSILTKADVDEKGGAPLSIAYIIKKPILFLGVGQKYEDLEKFNSQIILERLGF